MDNFKEYQPIEMICVDDDLPPMFQEVLVYGKLYKQENYGFHIARRWTGYSGPNPEKYVEWLTDMDYSVEIVTHWTPRPVFKGSKGIDISKELFKAAMA